MECKILFTDMDGTLLNDEKTISHQVHEAMERFTKGGGRVVLSSGRPLAGILEAKERLGLHYPGMYLIAYNGALVYDCDMGRPLFEQRLSFSHVKEAMEVARDLNIHCQTYSDTHIIAEKDCQELQAYRKSIPMPYMIVDNAAQYLESISHRPYKLIAIDFHSTKLEALRLELSKKLSGKLHALYSQKNYLEIIHQGVSKGEAVAFLCRHQQIPIEQTIAVGDAPNDISMLKAAGIGIAMKNATEETKEAADYVTKHTNNEDGILEIFERWALIK